MKDKTNKDETNSVMSSVNGEKPQKQNICNAGEYYLASYLSAHDFVATVTLGRAEKFDLLVVNPKGKPFKISVKTRLPKTKRFALDQKCENIEEDNLFYAFISLDSFQSVPNFWIVPSKVVAKSLRDSHRKWRNTPNMQGGEHNETKIRNFCLYNEKYYPANWEQEVQKYEKNIDMLK